MAEGFNPDAYLKKKSAPQGFDPDAYLANKSKPEKSTLEKFGDAFESYTGAPSRAAVSSLLKNPTGLGDAASEFSKNFGGDPSKAPSAKDVAIQLGEKDVPAELSKSLNKPFSVKGLATRTLGNLIGGPALGEVVARAGAKFLDDKGVTDADIASVPVSIATDWTNLAAPSLSALIKSARVAKPIAQIATKVDDVVRNADDVVKGVVKSSKPVESGLSAIDTIKLANEGGDKLNIKEITESAKRLGFKPTRGMTTNNMVIRGMESSLEQSPSVAGSMIRGETEKVRKGLGAAVENLTKNTTSYSKFEIGEKVKNGIIEKIALRYEPLSQQFNKLRESTAFIDIPDKSKLTLANNFMKHPDVALAPNSSWGAKAKQFGDYLINAKSTDDVKRLRTLVGNEIKASTNPNEQRVLSSIYGSLTRLEENSIKRAAIATARNTKEGAQIGKQMLGDLRQAKKGYKGLMTDIAEVGQSAGLKKHRTIEDFLDLVENVPSEEIGNRLFKTNNLKALNVIESQFPSEFSLLRQQKVTDLVQKSLTKGQLDPLKLTKAVKGMGPEVITKIFGGNANTVLKDVQTVLDSMPNMMGPSGTPQGQMFLDMVNLPFQGKEMLRYIGYKKLQNPTIPIEAVKNATIKFKKAGEATPQGLADLIDYSNRVKMGINAVRAGTEEKTKPRK